MMDGYEIGCRLGLPASWTLRLPAWMDDGVRACFFSVSQSIFPLNIQDLSLSLSSLPSKSSKAEIKAPRPREVSLLSSLSPSPSMLASAASNQRIATLQSFSDRSLKLSLRLVSLRRRFDDSPNRVLFAGS